MDKKTFYEILRSLALLGKGGSGTVTRFVYGTSDGKIYQLADGDVYRVKKQKGDK